MSEAIRICKTCLCPGGECSSVAVSGVAVSVSLAALELLSSIAMLQFDNFSESHLVLPAVACCNCLVVVLLLLVAAVVAAAVAS